MMRLEVPTGSCRISSVQCMLVLSQDLAEWITSTVSQKQYQTAALPCSNTMDEQSPPTTGQLDLNSPDPIRLDAGKSRQRDAYEDLKKLQKRMHMVSQKIMEERTAKVAGFSPAAPGSGV